MSRTAATFADKSPLQRPSSGGSTTKNPIDGVPAGGGAYAATRNTKMSAAMLGRSGGSQAHDNREPYQTLNYIIALQGIFPSRD